MTTFEVVVVGKTCGETFELVRFHGAVCGNGCGCGLRAGKILPSQRGLLKSRFFHENNFSDPLG